MEKRILLFSFIIGLLCGANALGVTDSAAQIQSLDVSIKEVPADISTTLEPQITTISPPITSEKTPETTVKPDEKITSSTSTTSTPAPTTTTTEKTSTVPVTTTTKATTTTSTTPVPTTTTTPAPTPTPSPTPTPPAPQPEVATWTTPCILLQLASQLNITYKTKDNRTENILYNIPLNATVEDSNCEGNGSQQIQVNWNSSTGQNSYAFFFVKNDTSYSSFYLYIIRLVIEISDDVYPNAENQTLHLFYQSAAKSNFRTPINMSYHCTRKQSLMLARTLNETESAGTLTISHVQMEAFHTGDSKKFSTAKDCDASEISDAVPIAVGVSLAVLILIMLIAYLVARRSSSARGYMSF